MDNAPMNDTVLGLVTRWYLEEREKANLNPDERAGFDERFLAILHGGVFVYAMECIVDLAVFRRR